MFHVRFTKVTEKSPRPGERSSPLGEMAEAVGGRMEVGALGWGLFLSHFSLAQCPGHLSISLDLRCLLSGALLSVWSV